MSDRRLLHRQALRIAADLRDRLDLDQFAPADPYAAAAALGAKVVFLNASMEGFYFKGSPARILLSSLRPVPRRAFTCGHELAHHVLGHGSTISALREDGRPDSDKPEEILANAVAAYFLMPTVGLRGAFARRGWTIDAATPLQVFIVSCEFGVGYLTLLSHLHYTLRDLSAARHRELARFTPGRIRRGLLEEECESFVVVDRLSEVAAVEVERGAAVLLPPGTLVTGPALVHLRSTPDFEVYRAHRRGCSSTTAAGTAREVRVMPKEYEGPANNRFLEDPDEET